MVDQQHTPELPALPAPSPAPVPPPPGEWTIPIAVGVMQLAGLASIGAGLIHAGVVGLHAEFTTLARLFVAVAVAQLAVGLLALVKGGRLAAVACGLVNLGAVAAWGATRLWDIDWIAGLEVRERPEFTDTACAALGFVAVTASVVALARGRMAVTRARLGVPGLTVGAVAVVAMLLGTDHVHSHDAGDTAHSHDTAPTGASDGTEAAASEVQAIAQTTAAWPRPWDPADGIDLSGVPGVTREQELRAAGLIQRTLRDLPRFADVTAIYDLGFRTIGDASTGFEHWINYGSLDDGKTLDPTAPESLVYRVDGDAPAGRTLVSAMYIVMDTPVDDPELVDYGGSLMQWHTHENLCWTEGDDGPRVVGVLDANGNCPAGSVKAGGGNPMVHVWIAPHECGPFAALEGHGAGQVGDVGADGARVDQCALADGSTAAATATPWDPELPIDLSGTPGVTPQQQAFAENLIARTLHDLPQWSDPEDAEAAGFRSIRDGATGHEHYIQWDWINDDVILDPDFPESLVYEPQPDGSKQLVSVMYMLPDSYDLGNLPDWGGALMQWHIHNDLCFDVSGEAPRLGGLTDAAGTCTARSSSSARIR